MAKKKISDIISDILDLTVDKLKYDPEENYVSVGLYDCGGSSCQVWLDYGISGERAHRSILINGYPLIEGETLFGTLLEIRNILQDPKSTLKLTER